MHNLDEGVFKNKFMQYIYNHAVIISQACSVLLGGDPDESVSSRLGKAERAGKFWAEYIVCPVVDNLVLAFTGQARHCFYSIEDDEGKKTVWDWAK